MIKMCPSTEGVKQLISGLTHHCFNPFTTGTHFYLDICV
ncbi:hypothetical protein E2C01_085872 [Portunus trituberculatus]|uniref:Uncharacterized protein n=1 Tax=Portunus trituberculatus TaxID=210409 RepID=A0A5B7JD37_PORTR|nr:hypothetical protein [Portunus trituberculatus]